ncbi:MAG TPA: ABC transporter ATP-binding protein, partial [Nocardioides sp.]
FTTADALEVTPVSEQVGGLTLQTDEAGRPRGWSGPDTNGTLLPTEGSFTAADSLRAVADLVLLSPAGAAVRVDGQGRADGLVPHGSLAAWVRQRQADRLGERVAG